MDERATKLDPWLETYARQVAAFDGLLGRLREVPLGEQPLSLEVEDGPPRG